MMLNTLRGLVLAAGVAAVPAFAQAECPPPESIDRYAQTARDALVALDGLVPEEQQRGLEDRYAAMSILRWSGQGRDIILNDQSALDAISQCIESGRCSAEASERSGAGPRTIAPFPSDRLVSWANRQLECDASSATDSIEAAPAEPEQANQPEEEIAAAADANTESDTATVDEQPAEEAVPETVIAIETEPEPVAPTSPEDESFADAAPDPGELPATEETIESVVIDPDDIETEDAIAVAEADPATETVPVIALSPIAEEASQRLVRMAVSSMMKGNVQGGVDFISQACIAAAEQTGWVQSCELVFDHYDQLATRADPIRFLAFTDQLCRLNYARGCASLATYFGVASTAEAHLAAIKFYDRACNSGDAEACAAASDYFLTGRASIADPERARDTLYRSCDLGRLASCQDLAEFYARGVGGDVDLARALELNDVSCPIGQNAPAETCVAAANFVLLNLEAGPERAERVRTFTERACRIGHDVGCAWHADNLEFGIGGEVDLAGAKQARVTACQLGHRPSCDASS